MNDSKSPILVFEQYGKDRDVVHEEYYELLIREAAQ